MVIKISKHSSENDIRKALTPLIKKKSKKTLADFYGKLKESMEMVLDIKKS